MVCECIIVGRMCYGWVGFEARISFKEIPARVGNHLYKSRLTGNESAVPCL
jgi:hypothetical protein